MVGELHRIGDQVGNNLPDPQGIAEIGARGGRAKKLKAAATTPAKATTVNL